MSVLPSSDFVAEAIFDRLPSRCRTSGTGFTNFNCPICGDKRGRCGVKLRVNGVGVHCFNCGFKAGWTAGSGLLSHMREFLVAIGLSEMQIAHLAYRASALRSDMLKKPELREQVYFSERPTFQLASLPPQAKSFVELTEIGCDDPDFVAVQAYVKERGRDAMRFQNYHWSPDRLNNINRRVIIPFEQSDRVVGWTARAIDMDVKPRYFSKTPANFLFNPAALHNPEREIVILAEGVFDAIGLDCVGLLGARLNAAQIAWIRASRKRVILLPDRDKRGLEMIDIALREKWEVAFPWNDGWWDDCIKDAAEACRVYGRLFALTSVLENAVDGPARIYAHRLRLG